MARPNAPADPNEPDTICRIVAGELPAAVVHRDDDAIAFLDRAPLFAGHTLVCPTRHVATLLDVDDAGLAPVLALARAVAAAQQRALGAQGTFVAMNNVVSQSIPHLHLHVVPRTKGDGLRGFFWPRRRYGPGEAERYAARLAEALPHPEALPATQENR